MNPQKRNVNVIIVCGLPGSGKSFFASHLAGRLHGVYVSSDRVRMEMFPVRTYSDDEKRAVYNQVLQQALEAVKTKRPVVADGTFYRRSLREKFLNALKEHAQVFFIEVYAAEDLAHERIKKPRPYSEAGPDVYTKIKGQWEPLEEDHLALESTGNNIDDMLRKAAAYLAANHDS